MRRDRDPDLRRRDPWERGPSRDAPRLRDRKGFNYTLVVGFAVLAVAGLALLNTLRSEQPGTLGLGDAGVGEPLPEFAVPVAVSDLDGDANVDPEEACGVEGSDVIRVCDLLGEPSLISFWWTRGAEDCVEQQSVLERVAGRFRGRVGFLSINVRDDRDEVREIVRDGGWEVPVGYDRDGAVSNAYRVGLCPTFVLSYPDGVMRSALVGVKSEADLTAEVRSLIDASKRREARQGNRQRAGEA